MTQRKTPFDVMAAHTEPRKVLKVDVLASCAHFEDDALRDDDDPLVDVWAFLCVWADGRACAMAGADVGQPGGEPDEDDLRRDFALVETTDPGLVQACLAELGLSTGN